jgi:hypothetical protein
MQRHSTKQSCTNLQGDKVAQIVLFSIDHDIWARLAASLLLLQAPAPLCRTCPKHDQHYSCQH